MRTKALIRDAAPLAVKAVNLGEHWRGDSAGVNLRLVPTTAGAWLPALDPDSVTY